MQPNGEQYENQKDLEKNRDFLFNIVYKFYENDVKHRESISTSLGFLIAANGVILLALITLFQIVASNGTITLNNSWQILLAIVLNLTLTCTSIWLSASYLLSSQPISFSVEKTPIELINQPYVSMHQDIFDSLNAIIEHNEKKSQKSQKFLFGAYVTFGFSIVMILLDVGIFIITKIK